MNTKLRLSILAAAAIVSLGGTASLAQQASNMTFFITSHGPGKGGDLGGIAGADAHCQALAQAAGVGNDSATVFPFTVRVSRICGSCPLSWGLAQWQVGLPQRRTTAQIEPGRRSPSVLN